MLKFKGLDYYLLRWTNWRAWKAFERRCIDRRPICDLKLGVGYYLHDAIETFSDPVRAEFTQEFPLYGNMIGMFKLIFYTKMPDYVKSGLVKWSEWQLMSVKGDKLISDMSFPEYLSLIEKFKAQGKEI